MGRWTHAMCEACWEEGNPGREPWRAVEGPREKCCFCGEETRSGIYVRGDPSELPCKGEHEEG